MPWNFLWSDYIKKRACRYLLSHYLGHFLEEKLTLDQLSIDLYNGTGIIRELSLDVVSLNQALDHYNVPVEIVEGYIGSITVTIPWAALINESTLVQVDSLELTLQPKQRQDNGDVGIEEMFSSIACMTSSLQLASEVLKEPPTEGEQRAEESPRYEKVEMFAQTIDTVLSHVRVTFAHTTIRLEHLPRDADVGVGLELRIERTEYFDDIVDAFPEGTQWQPAFANKNLHFMGVQMFVDEFHRSARTFTRANSYDSMGDEEHDAGETKEGTWPGGPVRSDSVPFLQSNPIQVAMFSGEQQLKIKIKQNELVQGPKLELECELGMMHTLVTPRQVHILMELIGGLATPWTCDDSNLKHKNRKQPSMRPNYPGRKSRSISTRESSVCGSTLYSHDDEIYHSALPGSSGLVSDAASTSSYITEYTFDTNKASTIPTIKHGSVLGYQTQPGRDLAQKSIKDAHSRALEESSADLTHYKLKTNFLSVTVLHENFSSSPGDRLSPGETANEKLKKLSKSFFQKVARIAAAGLRADLSSLRDDFSTACPLDHLGCLCKPLSIDCTQKMSQAGRSLSLDLSVGDCELVEALFDRSCVNTPSLGFSASPKDRRPAYAPILIFHPLLSQSNYPPYDSLYYTSTPCIRIKIDNVNIRKRSPRKTVPPKMDISFELGRFEYEMDITIIDRIHTLLHPDTMSSQESSMSQLAVNQPLSLTGQQFLTQALDEEPPTDSKLDIHVYSSSCRVYFKFPIPVMGAQHEHLAWWHRSLRKEVLIIDLHDFTFNTSICDADYVSQLDFMFREAHGLFQESPTCEPVSIVYVTHGTQQKLLTNNEGFNWPRVVVKWCSKESSVLEDNVESDDTTHADSLNGACQFSKPELSPFSCRKSMFGSEGLSSGSDVPHTSEEMVLPGDKDEMRHFHQACTSNTRLYVDIYLPKVLARVHDRALLEIIYNRINNDLLLWEPCAPSPLRYDKRSPFTGGQSLPLNIAALLQSNTNSFKLNLNDSASDSDESLDPLYSIHDKRVRHKRNGGEPSKICVSLKIVDGQLLVGTPLNDDHGVANCRMQGELLLHVQHARLFAVSEFNGDPSLKYVSIQSNSAKVFHDSSVDIPDELGSLFRCDSIPPSQSGLPPCIYKSSPGMYTKHPADVGSGPDSHDMLSVAIKIKLDSPSNLKEFLVSLAVRGATLRHRTCPPGHSWITQLLDFISVKDYPIQGYQEPKVITELHVHLWNCAVDYRPLYLPIQAVVVVETFTISSNIIANSPLSLLRFTIDDACLFLSDKSKTKDINVKKDYVCVMDVERFELSLLHNDGKDQKIPRTNLQASTNRVNLRTCSDSARALFDLIQYYVSDSDLDPDRDIRDECNSESREGRQEGDRDRGEEQDLDDDSYITADSDTVIGVNSDTSNVTSILAPTNPVDDLMADAMREDSSSPSPDMEPSAGARVFFMPDSGDADDDVGIAAGRMQPHEIMIAESQHSYMDESPGSSQYGDTDDLDDFCVIDEPGLGIMSGDGEPVIRIFSQEPIKMRENHFSLPIGRADELKAPLDFPHACYRYTLKEMTLTCFLYGGHDLELYKAKKAYTEECTRLRTKSGNQGKSKNTSNNSTDENWLICGGPRRNMDVLVEVKLCKVRMQLETYPETSVLVTRKVVIINDIEVCDRLAVSSINKFLYQYTSETRPKQTHANMVLIKALTTRCANASTNECSLKVAILPVRLNFDQDTLLFLRRFMLELSADEPSDPHRRSSQPRPAPHPIMSLNEGLDAEKLSPDQLIKFDELSANQPPRDKSDETSDPQQPVFFKSFVFSPEVPIRLDYKGKRLDMYQGTLTGLLAGLAQLNCSELRLKRLDCKHGLLGLDKVFAYCMSEWLADVKKNQLPGILGGVGPMHSFVQIVQGIRDLFWLPIEQYQRDGRLVRGIQRGATSFTTSTAMALLELTNRVVQSVQYVAEVTYDVIAPGPFVHQATSYQQLQHKIRHSLPPNDFREGISNAYHVISEGISGTAKNIVHVASAEHERKGLTGAVGGVLRQIPPTMVQPIIIASAATSNVLGGMRNQLKPDAKKEDDEKWKEQTQQ